MVDEKIVNRVRTLILLSGAAAVVYYGLATYPGWLAWGVGMVSFFTLLAWVGVRRWQGHFPGSVSAAELIFIAVVGWLAVLQAHAAGGLYSLERIPLDEANFYDPVLVIVHFLFLNFVLFRGPTRPGLNLLYAGVVYSGLLYLPTFETPEAGVPFMLPAVIACAGMLFLGPMHLEHRQGWLFFALGLTTLAGFAATVTSYAPGESLVWMFKWVVLGLLMIQLFLFDLSRIEWKQLMAFTLVSSLLPVLVLGSMKMVQVVDLFGFTGLFYRLNIVELGRANLISRELMLAFPLLIALLHTMEKRWLRRLMIAWAVLAILLFGFTQSAGGLVGATFTLLIFFWLARGWRLKIFLSGRRFWLWGTGISLLSLVFLVGAMFAASRMNVGSFNGRLFQFRASLSQIAAHPWLGVGPGVYHVKAQVVEGIDWVIDSRLTIDNPLLPVQWYQDSTRLHAHNLFLEIGVGLGLPGLVFFIAFLILLFWQAFSIYQKLSNEMRILLVGSIVALSAIIGWGFLDVMQATAPFFGTSGWILAGLVISAVRFVEETPRKMEKNHWRWRFGIWALSGGVLVILLAMLGANWNYRQAYRAMLDQEWEKASQKLTVAALWEPYNGKYAQLRGDMLINLGQFTQALQSYRKANLLKREFPPYLQQSGWLEILNGNLQAAESDFSAAVKADSNAAWKNDHYSALGLWYAANGNSDLAVQAFAKEISLDPTTASLPHWRKVLRGDGRLEVVLDPAYLGMQNPGIETQKRIWQRLGRADVTVQNFAWQGTDGKDDITLNQVFTVLEQMAADPQISQHDHISLLASLTSAAQSAGLNVKAREYAQEFIQLNPKSAFGYLLLAKIAISNGDLASAQSQVDLALKYSPSNTEALIMAAQLAALTDNLSQYVQIVDRLAKEAPFHLEAVRLQLAIKGRDTVKILRNAAVLDTSIASRLDLTEVLLQRGKEVAAREQCTIALQRAALINQAFLSESTTRLGKCLANTAPHDYDNLLSTLRSLNPKLMGWMKVFTLQELGENDQALQAARKMQAKEFGQWVSSFILALQEQDGGDVIAAETALIHAANLDARQSKPWERLGSLYGAQGRYNDALSAYEQSVKTAPGKPEVWLLLAKTAFQQDQNNLAMDSLISLRAILGTFIAGEQFNLFVNLPTAQLQESSDGQILPDIFYLFPEPLPTIFMHPDSKATFPITLPGVQEGERVILHTFVGTSQESWNQEGDGVEFKVIIRIGNVENILYETTIDPKHNVQERRWIPVEVDLTPWAGEDVALTLATSAGQEGDLRYDWSGWGDPSIIVLNQQPPE